MRETQYQSFNATVSSSKSEKEDIMCKAISAIDSVYNRTMALECEFKGLSYQAVPKWLKVLSETVKLLSLPDRVSRMPSMKRPAAVFARAAATTSKTGSIGANVVPNVKSKDPQREPTAWDATLQAVGQRGQLVPEVLAMISEALPDTLGVCKDQCFEEKNLCRVCQATRKVVLSKTNSSS